MTICLILMAWILKAQEIKKDEIGRLVLVTTDGSWRYIQPKDSLLVKNLDENRLSRFYNESEKKAFRNKYDKLKTYEIQVANALDGAINSLYFVEERYYKSNPDQRAERLRIDLKAKRNNVIYHRRLLRQAKRMVKKFESISKEEDFASADSFVIPVYKQQSVKTANNIATSKRRFLIFRKSQQKSDVSMLPVQDKHAWLPPLANYNYGTSVKECTFKSNQYDSFTGNNKLELDKELLFRYSDPQLLPYLKGNDYLVAHANLMSVSGGYRYLRLEIDINSKNAVKEYGYIENGGILNLKFLDGSTISLFSQNAVRAKILEDNVTRYEILYAIDYQKQKLMRKSELDIMRIVWSSGYEDYEVSCVNFFMKQFECLER